MLGIGLATVATLTSTVVLFIRFLRTQNDVAGGAMVLAIWQLILLLVTVLCAVAGFYLARMLKRRPKQ
jgi:hypothetical protein